MSQLEFSFDKPHLDEKIIRFKGRELRAKEVFKIVNIDKKIAYDFVRKYHYLGDAKFFAVSCFGLYIDGVLFGVSTFNNPQGISAIKGWVGGDNSNKRVLELGRLCLHPTLNGSNATSYLLSNSMKMLRGIDLVITLADNSRHVGSIYQVCNFKYYGLTDKKSDFFGENGKVNERGSTKDRHGVWLPRSRKHRYGFILNKDINILYTEQCRPSTKETEELSCCNGDMVVYDNRFNKKYTCPRCTGNIIEIK